MFLLFKAKDVFGFVIGDRHASLGLVGVYGPVFARKAKYILLPVLLTITTMALQWEETAWRTAAS